MLPQHTAISNLHQRVRPFHDAVIVRRRIGTSAVLRWRALRSQSRCTCAAHNTGRSAHATTCGRCRTGRRRRRLDDVLVRNLGRLCTHCNDCDIQNLLRQFGHSDQSRGRSTQAYARTQTRYSRISRRAHRKGRLWRLLAHRGGAWGWWRWGLWHARPKRRHGRFGRNNSSCRGHTRVPIVFW